MVYVLINVLLLNISVDHLIHVEVVVIIVLTAYRIINAKIVCQDTLYLIFIKKIQLLISVHVSVVIIDFKTYKVGYVKIVQ
jgi:hypothetical protein